MKQLTQTTPRLYAGYKIKRLVKNLQVREGTKRFVLTEAVLKARTVDAAFATPCKWKRRTLYPASADVRFAVNAGIIELI